MLVTSTKEAQKMRVLNWVPYICYRVQFQKDKDKDILVFLDFGSKINIMTPAYAAQLDIKVQSTNVGTQKIDKSSLRTYGLVIAIFQVLDKLDYCRFFQETFLLANIRMKVVLSMFFLTFNNTYI